MAMSFLAFSSVVSMLSLAFSARMAASIPFASACSWST